MSSQYGREGGGEGGGGRPARARQPHEWGVRGCGGGGGGAGHRECEDVDGLVVARHSHLGAARCDRDAGGAEGSRGLGGDGEACDRWRRSVSD